MVLARSRDRSHPESNSVLFISGMNSAASNTPLGSQCPSECQTPVIGSPAASSMHSGCFMGSSGGAGSVPTSMGIMGNHSPALIQDHVQHQLLTRWKAAGMISPYVAEPLTEYMKKAPIAIHTHLKISSRHYFSPIYNKTLFFISHMNEERSCTNLTYCQSTHTRYIQHD